jgi:hypothetical protein
MEGHKMAVKQGSQCKFQFMPRLAGKLKDKYTQGVGGLFEDIEHPTRDELANIAAFCINELSVTMNEDGESYRDEAMAAKVLNAVGKLAMLSEEEVPVGTYSYSGGLPETSDIVEGR